MKRKLIFILILLLMVSPCFARKVTSVTERIEVLQDMFKGEEVEQSGNVWYVDGSKSHSGDGKTWDGAFLTIQEAIGFCTANKGDVIYIAPDHGETITSAGGISQNVAGITIKGKGNGDLRPNITFSTSAGASWYLNADNCVIDNIIFYGSLGVENLATMITVTGEYCTISNCEFRDGDTVPAGGLGAITVGAEDEDSSYLTIQNCTFYQPGTNNDHSIEILFDMVGVKIIDNIFYGDYDEGAIVIPAGGNESLNLLIDKNTITNKRAGGAGISINGTSSTVILGENAVAVDDPDNAYSFDTSIIQPTRNLSLMGSAIDGTDVYPASIADDSLWAKVLSKSATPSASSYSNLTDSLQAVADHVQTLITTAAGSEVYPSGITNESIIAYLMSKSTTPAASSYSNETDSLEMISDKLGAYAGTSGAGVAESIKASLTLAHTDLDTIITNVGYADANIVLILEDTGTTLPATLATIGGVVDDANANVTLILEDTGTTLPATLAVINGIVDDCNENVTLILEDTGTTLPATLATIQGLITSADTNVTVVLADTNELQTDWTDGGRLDSILDDANSYAYDANGYAQDANKYAYDANRYAYDANGYAQDANGYAYDANRYAYDANGYAQDANDYAYDANRYAYDANGYAQDANDYAYDANRYAYDANRYAYDANSFAYDANRYAYDANRYAYDANLLAEDINNALFGADGITTFPAAAQADDGVSIAEVLRYVQEKQLPRMELKANADMTGYDDAAWFTVTGDVMVRVVGVVGNTAITSTGGACTLSIGTAEAVAGIIAASTVNNTQFAATDVWVDASPSDDCEVMDAGVNTWHIIGGGADIVLTRTVDDITGGKLTLYCWWVPLSSDGDVTAAP